MAALRVVTVPILEDNYAYLLIDSASKCAAAVDPADAKTVVAAASREGVKLTHVLTTHGHWDHAGGNHDMVFLPHIFPICFAHFGMYFACMIAVALTPPRCRVSGKSVPGHRSGGREGRQCSCCDARSGRR